jgi:hypothetical protein
VSLAGTGTLNANNMCYIAKCVSGIWSNIYGPLLIPAINVGNTSRTTNLNDWYLHSGSHLLTQSGIIVHPGLIVPVPGNARFEYLRFNTNTNTTVTEGVHPLISYSSVFSYGVGHYGVSYGYSTALGYYQMVGNYNLVTSTIRSSRDVRKPSVAANASNPDYTEAQWFAGSGYDINAICNGQTGLSVAIKPYPIYIGGYQTNIAEVLLPLLPNRPKQNIYILKTDVDRLSNIVYSSLEDEPVGFTKQLIATVVTDDEKVTNLRTFSIGISIPPNESGAVRYLSNVDGECGWVTASDIIAGGTGAPGVSPTKILGSVSGTVNIDLAAHTAFTMTVTGAFSLNIQNPVTGQSFVIIIKQDATGSRAVTWPGTMLFSEGFKTISTAANATDLLTAYYDGTNYYASLTSGYA